MVKLSGGVYGKLLSTNQVIAPHYLKLTAGGNLPVMIYIFTPFKTTSNIYSRHLESPSSHRLSKNCRTIDCRLYPVFLFQFKEPNIFFSLLVFGIMFNEINSNNHTKVDSLLVVVQWKRRFPGSFRPSLDIFVPIVTCVFDKSLWIQITWNSFFILLKQCKAP